MLGHNPRQDNYSENNAYFDVCLLPFYSEYDDYGGGIDSSGIGLNYVMDALANQLLEMDPGPNQYYDIPVTKKGFNVIKMFEYNIKHRLQLEDSKNSKFLESYRLSATLSDQSNSELLHDISRSRLHGRTTTHVMIHIDIFDHILEHYEIIDYLSGENIPFKDRKFVYRFFDVVASVPEYISAYRANRDKPGFFFGEHMFNGKTQNLAAKWLSFFKHKDSFLINISDLILAESYNLDDTKFSELLIDILKGQIINDYMSASRRVWVKSASDGDQSNRLDVYQILIDGMQQIINKEKF